MPERPLGHAGINPSYIRRGSPIYPQGRRMVPRRNLKVARLWQTPAAGTRNAKTAKSVKRKNPFDAFFTEYSRKCAGGLAPWRRCKVCHGVCPPGTGTECAGGSVPWLSPVTGSAAGRCRGRRAGSRRWHRPWCWVRRPRRGRRYSLRPRRRRRPQRRSGAGAGGGI